MMDAHPVSQRDRRERRFEILATLVLALSALATAWSSYQASLWDGEQSKQYAEASGLRTESSLLQTEANQQRLAHLSLIEGYITGVISGDEGLATFYSSRFPDELRVAFDAWIALDPLSNAEAPALPLAMPEYSLALDRAALELSDAATAAFAEGETANGISDVLTLATVLFASALFFAAVSERFEYVPARITLLVLATLGLLAGLAVSLTQPATFG